MWVTRLYTFRAFLTDFLTYISEKYTSLYSHMHCGIFIHTLGKLDIIFTFASAM